VRKPGLLQLAGPPNKEVVIIPEVLLLFPSKEVAMVRFVAEEERI
jgi:hypothetical protein